MLMFAFILPFLFSACEFSDLPTTPRNSNINTDYSERPQGGVYTPTNDYPGVNPEFTMEDGKYVYFSPYWDAFDGIRLVSTPTDVENGEGVSEQTKTERANYFGDVYSQFEILYLYIKNYMLCQFDQKVSDSIITISSTSGRYSTKFAPFEPTILTTFDGGDVEYNKKVGNTTSGMMDGDISGWTISATSDPLVYEVSGVVRDGTNHPFVVNFKNGDETKNKNFVILRLMEVMLGVETATNFNDTEALANAQKTMRVYESAFQGLGNLTLGSVTDAQSVASKIKRMILNEVIGSQTVEYYQTYQRNYNEPYAPGYTDSNANGKFDEGEGPYVDINKNGSYDAPFQIGHQAFYADFDAIVTNLVKELAAVSDGEEDADLNRNEQIDKAFPVVVSVEVQDEDSETFFEPGIAEDGAQKRMLTNMNYSEYKSVMLIPSSSSPLISFNTLDIYIDSETDFVLDIYLKVFIDEHNYFCCHICSLNLDHTKSCDWGNEESSPEIPYDVPDEERWEMAFDYSDIFNISNKRNCFSMLPLADLFEYITKNFPNDYVLVCQNPGSLSPAEVMMRMVEPGYLNPLIYGVGRTDEEITYSNGAHTSLTDNLDLAEKYSYQQINQKGDTALCYAGTTSHVEFIFNVANKDASVEHNFKFLIQPSDNKEEEDGEEDEE